MDSSAHLSSMGTVRIVTNCNEVLTMADKVYTLEVASDGAWLSFTVRGEKSLKYWVESWTKQNYRVRVLHLTEKEIANLEQRTRLEVDKRKDQAYIRWQITRKDKGNE